MDRKPTTGISRRTQIAIMNLLLLCTGEYNAGPSRLTSAVGSVIKN
jgi:hypothetical protein